jgi:multidrug transporter EmrE-like cation transporter
MRLGPLLGAYVLLSTSGVLLLRHALDVVRSPDEPLLRTFTSPGALAGAVLYAASFGLWLLALRRYPVTTVYPLFVGAGVLGVALGGWMILGEAFTLWRAVGALAVVVGVALLAR